jgi:5'(3')-deoxyribonucleotidase
MSASRYDSGKTRHELLPPHAINEIAKVYTMGAQKYAPHNWRKGMAWSRVIGSLKRHLNELENCRDYDEESGLLHAAHVAWNAITLLEYYKIYPQGDDRPHSYLHVAGTGDAPGETGGAVKRKIGLDIDEVLCDFIGGWRELNQLGDSFKPETWHFDRTIREKFEQMKKDGTLDEFYLDLQPLIYPRDIPFEPHCYVTSRPVDTKITEMWLKMHGFPQVPVYTVPMNTSKAEALKKAGVDIFVDDKYDNFVDLNKAGICTYLYDASHNQKYDVGYKRIKSLRELV